MNPDTPARNEADTTDPRAAHNGERPRQTAETNETAYPNGANERDGKGSPYAGTQSPDAAAPDGNQLPKSTENTSPDDTKSPDDLGSEYADASSMGKGQTNEGYGGSEPSHTDTDAAGTPVR